MHSNNGVIITSQDECSDSFSTKPIQPKKRLRLEKGIMVDIDDAARAYRRLFNEKTIRAMLDMAAHFEEMKKPEYKSCASDLGWLRFLTVDQFEYFYKSYRQRGAIGGWKNVEDVFSDSQALSAISDTVRSCRLVKKRMDVIQRGLDAHREGDFIASVSILLPQVEGIVWDIGVAKDLVSPERNSRKRSSGKGEWTFYGLVDEIWPNPHQVDKFRGKIKNEYYSESLRHPCLHGRDLRFFNKEDSTRVVLMIWGVVEESVTLGPAHTSHDKP
jgi:hypothetical protein